MSLLQKILVILCLFLAGALIVVLFLPDSPPHKGNEIPCESMEGAKIHFHLNLQLYKDGKSMPLPHNIGIIGDCFYWLHTHEEDGIIHVESPILRDFSIGEFFDIWGVNEFDKEVSIFSQKNLNVRVKNKGDTEFHEILGKWSDLKLSDHQIIAIGTGEFVPSDFRFPADL